MKKAERKKNNERVRKVLLSKQFCISVLVVMSLLAFICLLKLVLGFLPVSRFTYRGDTHYDISELINASGIRSGDRLYKIDEKAAVASMVRECPYLKTVKIEKKFPNTVCFAVEEQEPGWYMQVGNDFYGLDFDLKVLLETYLEQDFIDRGLTKLVLPEIESVIVGELPEFASDDEQLIKESLTIVDAFRTHGIKKRLTGLDISNRFEIKLEIDNSYEVYFGDMASFDMKMKFLEAVLKKAEDDGATGGRITWGDDNFVLKKEYSEKNEADGGTSSSENTKNDLFEEEN